MKTNKLGILIVGVILLQMSNMAIAANVDITPQPLPKKEIRFEIWDDKAAYEEHLFRKDLRNKPFGHLLKYAGTGNKAAILDDPQIHFTLSMLLGERFPQLLEILRGSATIDFFVNWLILEGGTYRGNFAQIKIHPAAQYIEVALRSGGSWTIYGMHGENSWVAGWGEIIFYRKEIEELADKPPTSNFRLISRPVRGNFGHLEQYNGTFNVAAIMNDPEMRRWLHALLGEKISLLYRNLTMHGNVSLVGGWLNFSGGKPHENDTDRADVAIGLQNGRLEVAILSDDIWTVYTSARNWREINGYIKEGIRWEAIADLISRSPRPNYQFHNWQPKGDHDVDQY